MFFLIIEQIKGKSIYFLFVHHIYIKAWLLILFTQFEKNVDSIDIFWVKKKNSSVFSCPSYQMILSDCTEVRIAFNL